MLQYILRRIIWMIPTIILTSVVAFYVIQLPPGSYVESYISNLAAAGDSSVTSSETLENLRETYGLNQPAYVQYFKWVSGMVTRGDLGLSFEYQQPVASIIGKPLFYTLIYVLIAVAITWLIAFPIGIYSAVRQYSAGDYFATFLAFIGISVPGFLLALLVMYLSMKQLHLTLGGFFSPELEMAPWSVNKIWDMLQHIWVPVLITAFGGAAGLIRILRANLLDEMRRPYVITARAKGLPEWKVITKYPLRLALNPFVSGLAFIVPNIVGTTIILSIIMNIPIAGATLFRSLTSQDMYLAGSIVLILSIVTIIGVLLSDILLSWLDPRIRYQ
jgi:peptide/nickel transport system permease protein